MYTLDFETVKQVMQEHQKTGVLYADVPSGISGLSRPCRIEIQLAEGAIVSCSIISDYGQRLSEKETIKKISRLGTLLWTFVPQTSVPASTPPASTTPTTPPALPTFTPPAFPALTLPISPLFPRRTLQLEREQMRSWPRLHRGIFALADGTRSAAKIAEILSTSPEFVDQALRDLQMLGVILLEKSEGRNSL